MESKEDFVVEEKANCPRSASQTVEGIEDQAKSGLHSSIGIKVERSVGAVYEAHGRPYFQFSAPRFVDLPAAHPRTKDMQLGLAHCSFQSQQQAIVETRRIVDPVFIKNKRRG